MVPMGKYIIMSLYLHLKSKQVQNIFSLTLSFVGTFIYINDIRIYCVGNRLLFNINFEQNNTIKAQTKHSLLITK